MVTRSFDDTLNSLEKLLNYLFDRYLRASQLLNMVREFHDELVNHPQLCNEKAFLFSGEQLQDDSVEWTLFEWKLNDIRFGIALCNQVQDSGWYVIKSKIGYKDEVYDVPLTQNAWSPKEAVAKILEMMEN